MAHSWQGIGAIAPSKSDIRGFLLIATGCIAFIGGIVAVTVYVTKKFN